jgi:acyl carrier protein
VTGPAAAPAGPRETFARASEERRRELLLLQVRRHTAELLGHPGPDTVRADEPFTELGLTSLSAVELRNRLKAVTGLRLPATLLFNFPTPERLAARLAEEFARPAAGAESALLAAVERLEAAFDTAGEADRTEAADRLRAVLQRAGAARDAVTAPIGALPEAATADEVLRFIDSELGDS